jgi:hypothetical protein
VHTGTQWIGLHGKKVFKMITHAIKQCTNCIQSFFVEIVYSIKEQITTKALVNIYLSYRCFFSHTPDVLSVRDTAGEPLGVGLLEVLEVDVGIVHVVNTTRSVGRGRHLQVSRHPSFYLQQ